MSGSGEVRFEVAPLPLDVVVCFFLWTGIVPSLWEFVWNTSRNGICLYYYLVYPSLGRLYFTHNSGWHLTDEHKIAVTLLPRVSGGKPLQVYSAQGSGERKALFLEHSLDCTQALLAGFHVPQIEPSLTLISLKDERTVKAMQPSSSIIPDGLVTYQTQTGECIPIAYEIDRSTSNNTRICEKYTGYPAWIQQMGLDALTIAFVVTSGDRKRVTALMELAKETIGDTDLASLFLFAPVPVDTIAPRLFLDPVFTGLDNSPHALL